MVRSPSWRLPFQITWVHPLYFNGILCFLCSVLLTITCRIFVVIHLVLVLSILRFTTVSCWLLPAVFSLFCSLPLYYLSLDLQLLNTPLLSLNLTADDLNVSSSFKYACKLRTWFDGYMSRHIMQKGKTDCLSFVVKLFKSFLINGVQASERHL